jgi:methylmalonyl-CoA carboxyltransferase large subunit
MARVTTAELAKAVDLLTAQVAEMSRRLEALEGRSNGAVKAAAAPVQPQAVAPGITEEELVAISAAIGAYLGVRAHIRQIRLVSSTAWAQQGRVSIQASHRLQG